MLKNLDRLESLFSALRPLSPAQRLKRMAELQIDGTIRSELESLLTACDNGKSFLSKISPLDNAPPPADPVAVGAYRITQKLGEGGMGVVYAAERADGAYTKLVAVKVMRYAIGEIATHRFINERQILAQLDHPHIARLLDGGTTEHGHPYLVMEYVDGCAIDRYCRQKALSLKQKLQLFRNVCGAVQYAHRNLIVHRDLKPANILVGADGEPKLLDFGIAKWLDEKKDSQKTADGAWMMTPQYAAPEQLNGQPITTATDVYALGLILYELLYGKKPYELNSNNISDWVKVVCDNPVSVPAKPAGRRTTWLKGDVDRVVLKALAKDPVQRYATPEALADDLTRYLSGHPVLARKSAPFYRAAKFILRNRMASALSAAVVAALTVGAVVSTYQWRLAQQQRELAEQRYHDVRTLANSLIFDVTKALEHLPGSLPVREKLLAQGLSYLDGLMEDHPDDPGLLHDTAAAYERIARVQGNPLYSNLGQTKEAIASYKKSLKIYEEVLHRRPYDRETLLRNARSVFAVSGMHAADGDYPQALRDTEQCLQLLGKLSKPLAAPEFKAFAACELAAAHWQNAMAAPDAAMAHLDRVQTMLAQRKLPTIRAQWLQTLSESYALRGDFSQALEYQEQVLKITQRVAKQVNRQTVGQELANVYHILGERYRQVGRFKEAEENYLTSVSLWQEMAQKEPQDHKIIRSLAATQARLAEFHWQIAQQNGAVSQKACDWYEKTRATLQTVPVSKIGFGVRVLGLPEVDAFFQTFSTRCG